MEDKVKSLKGVKSASFDPVNYVLSVEYSEKETDEAAIHLLIEKCGFACSKSKMPHEMSHDMHMAHEKGMPEDHHAMMEKEFKRHFIISAIFAVPPAHPLADDSGVGQGVPRDHAPDFPRRELRPLRSRERRSPLWRPPFLPGRGFAVSPMVSFFQEEITFFVRTFFFVYIGLLLSPSYFSLPVLGIASAILVVFILIRWSVQKAVLPSLSAADKVAVVTMLPRGLAPAVLAYLPLSSGLSIPYLQEMVFAVILLSNVAGTVIVFLIERRYAHATGTGRRASRNG